MQGQDERVMRRPRPLRCCTYTGVRGTKRGAQLTQADTRMGPARRAPDRRRAPKPQAAAWRSPATPATPPGAAGEASDALLKHPHLYYARDKRAFAQRAHAPRSGGRARPTQAHAEHSHTQNTHMLMRRQPTKAPRPGSQAALHTPGLEERGRDKQRGRWRRRAHSPNTRDTKLVSCKRPWWGASASTSSKQVLQPKAVLSRRLQHRTPTRHRHIHSQGRHDHLAQTGRDCGLPVRL